MGLTQAGELSQAPPRNVGSAIGRKRRVRDLTASIRVFKTLKTELGDIWKHSQIAYHRLIIFIIVQHRNSLRMNSSLSALSYAVVLHYETPNVLVVVQLQQI